MDANYITMVDRRQIDLHDFKLEDVSFDVISYALSRIARFAGNVADIGYPSTVAEHSMLVEDLVKEADPDAALPALLHDAHEAYVGDIITPVVRALGIEDEVHALKNHIQMRIHEAAGVPIVLSKPIQQIVEWADKEAFRIENAKRFEEQEYLSHRAAAFMFTERLAAHGVAV